MSLIRAKKNNTLSEIFDVIKKSKNPLCCLDSRLDCDAVSSALVMKRILKQNFGLNLELTFVSAINSHFQAKYEGIIKIDSIRQEVDPSTIIFDNYDLVILLDNGDPSHLSNNDDFKLPNNLTTINIDHHNDSNNCDCTYNYVVKAPSTCSIIYQILKSQKIKIDNTSAKLLMLGIIEDSGVFQYDKIRPIDLTIAANILKQTKKDLFWYTYRITYHEPAEEINLKKLTFINYRLDLKNKFAYSFASKTDYAKFDIPKDFKTGNSPADFIRKTEGINFAFFIREKEGDYGQSVYVVSFRSRLPDYDVSQIAGQFGGGGHIMSSACRINDAKNLNDAVKKIIEATNKYNLIK